MQCKLNQFFGNFCKIFYNNKIQIKPCPQQECQARCKTCRERAGLEEGSLCEQHESIYGLPCPKKKIQYTLNLVGVLAVIRFHPKYVHAYKYSSIRPQRTPTCRLKWAYTCEASHCQRTEQLPATVWIFWLCEIQRRNLVQRQTARLVSPGFAR